MCAHHREFKSQIPEKMGKRRQFFQATRRDVRKFWSFSSGLPITLGTQIGSELKERWLWSCPCTSMEKSRPNFCLRKTQQKLRLSDQVGGKQLSTVFDGSDSSIMLTSDDLEWMNCWQPTRTIENSFILILTFLVVCLFLCIIRSLQIYFKLVILQKQGP